MMQARRAAGRAVAVALFMLLLLLTAWVCVLAGVVVFLARPLGPVGALLSVGGGAVFLAFFVLLVFSLTRNDQRRTGYTEHKLPAALARAVMAVLCRPAALRVSLGTIALLLGIAALLLPGGKRGRNDHRS